MRKQDLENKGKKKKIKNSKINYQKNKIQNLKIRRKRKHIFKITEVSSQKLKEEKIDFQSNDKLIDKLFAFKKNSGCKIKKIQ
jgi:hypothetical protein